MLFIIRKTLTCGHFSFNSHKHIVDAITPILQIIKLRFKEVNLPTFTP